MKTNVRNSVNSTMNVTPVNHRMRFSHVGLAVWLFLTGMMPIAAFGNEITFTVSGTGSDGPLDASIEFVAINGGLEIIVTNTLPSSVSMSKGEAISAFSFGLTNLGNPTGFSLLSGNTVHVSTFSSGNPFPGSSTVTSFSDTPGQSTPNAIDHWGFSQSSGVTTLATAGSSVHGATGSPTYMILPSLGTTGPGNSLTNDHFDPYIIGPATFKLTDSSITSNTVLTAADFSQVNIGFGTSPDTTLTVPGLGPTDPHFSTVPEPSSLALLALGGFGFVFRRRVAAI